MQLKEVADIAGIQSELESKRGYVKQRQEEKLEKARLAGELTNKREAAQSELGSLLVKNTNNEKLLRRKAYAERMYEIMAAKYSEQEASVRTRLQSAINSVFKWIYDGGMSLVIADNYKIKVVLDDGTENVETSTAQSMSIIFAFIAGVIKDGEGERRARRQGLYASHRAISFGHGRAAI